MGLAELGPSYGYSHPCRRTSVRPCDRKTSAIWSLIFSRSVSQAVRRINHGRQGKTPKRLVSPSVSFRAFRGCSFTEHPESNRCPVSSRSSRQIQTPSRISPWIEVSTASNSKPITTGRSSTSSTPSRVSPRDRGGSAGTAFRCCFRFRTAFEAAGFPGTVRSISSRWTTWPMTERATQSTDSVWTAPGSSGRRLRGG